MIRMVRSSAPGTGADFPAELRSPLDDVGQVLIPGGQGYPSGGETSVSRFIAARVSAEDIAFLERLIPGLPTGDDEQLAEALSALEAEDPVSFARLRALIYHAYYSSPRLLAALADRGYGYHGAPQPLGYALDQDPPLPAHTRGDYVRTQEVRRVSL
jgi:hypothetical protein